MDTILSFVEYEGSLGQPTGDLKHTDLKLEELPGLEYLSGHYRHMYVVIKP